MKLADSNWGSIVASRAQPGSRILVADGTAYRVIAKNAMAGSSTFRLQAEGQKPVTVTAAALLAMKPIAPAIEKFARMVRLAFNEDFSDYINGAIKAAGYPVDPAMKWAPWLNKVFVPALHRVTNDIALIDEGIHAMIVNELYDKRILEADSKYAHFDPDNPALAGKPLENKVSAYLSYIFKRRIEWVRNFIVKELGALTESGTKSFTMPMPLEGPRKEGEEFEGSVPNYGESGADGKGTVNKELAENESFEEVRRFCEAFITTVRKMTKISDNTKELLTLITELVAAGNSRTEVRDEILASGLKSARGEELSLEHWKTLIKQWVQMIHYFAAHSKFADTPIGKLIAAQASSMGKAAAKIALSPTNPVAPVMPTPPVAPTNPNVTQQQQAQEQAAGTQPPVDGDFQKPGAPSMPNAAQAQEQAQNPQQGQLQQDPQVETKKTIPPEIPGVNHTASENKMPTPKRSTREEVIARIKAKRAAAGKNAGRAKFARLRVVSKFKAAEVAVALEELVDSLSGLAEDLTGLSDNLDLIPEVAEDASPEGKTAARKSAKYAAAFRRMAEETPEILVEHLQNVYDRLDDVTEGVENLADNLDVTLEEPSAERAEKFGEDEPAKEEPTEKVEEKVEVKTED